jgi:hypothetical protein
VAHGDPSVGIRATCAQAVQRLGFTCGYPLSGLARDRLSKGSEAQKLAAAEFLGGIPLQPGE